MRKVKKNIRNKGEEKSQNHDISQLCEPIFTNLVFVDLTDIVTFAKFSLEISDGFSKSTGGKMLVST
jgi:hypothetical protein